MLGVRFIWHWDISALARSVTGSAATDAPEVRGVGLLNEHTGVVAVEDRPERELCRFQGRVTGVPPASYVRVDSSFAEWTKGSDRVPLFRRMRAPGGPGRPPEFLVRQIAGLASASPEAAGWSLEGEERTERINTVRAEDRTLEAAVELALMQGRVLGEMPLRVGAELRAGASWTRISAIERTPSGLVVRLDDRAAQPVPAFESFGVGPQVGPLQPRLAEDVFVLVHRPTALVQVPVLHEVGAVQINSIFIGQRELVITPPTRGENGPSVELPGWRDDAVIIQVRFLPAHTFTRRVAGNPFTAAAGR